MFKIVEGAVPAGDIARVELRVSRDATAGKIVGTWEIKNGPMPDPGTVRRVQDRQLVAQAFKDAAAFAKKHEIVLSIIDPNNLFPPNARPEP
jgi:hypothetical protein